MRYQDLEVEDAIEHAEDYHIPIGLASPSRSGRNPRKTRSPPDTTKAKAKYKNTTTSSNNTSPSSPSFEHGHDLQSTSYRTPPCSTSPTFVHQHHTLGPNLNRFMDKDMDMDLHTLMAMVDEKYHTDNDNDDVDRIDLEELKRQYGFDD